MIRIKNYFPKFTFFQDWVNPQSGYFAAKVSIPFLGLVCMLFLFSCRPKESQQYYLEAIDSEGNPNFHELDEDIFQNHQLFRLNTEALSNPNDLLLLSEDIPLPLSFIDQRTDDSTSVISARVDADISSHFMVTHDNNTLHGFLRHDGKSYLLVGKRDTFQLSESFNLGPECSTVAVPSDAPDLTPLQAQINENVQEDCTIEVLIIQSNEYVNYINNRGNSVSVSAYLLEQQMRQTLSFWYNYGQDINNVKPPIPACNFNFTVVPSKISESLIMTVVDSLATNPEAIKLRETYSADLVGLMTRDVASDAGGSAIGVPDLGTSADRDSTQAFFWANWHNSMHRYTAIHEIGHLLGFHHDRANAGSPGNSNNCQFGYMNNSLNYGSMMAYEDDGWRLSAFSDSIPLIQKNEMLGVGCSSPGSASNQGFVDQAGRIVATYMK